VPEDYPFFILNYPLPPALRSRRLDQPPLLAVLPAYLYCMKALSLMYILTLPLVGQGQTNKTAVRPGISQAQCAKLYGKAIKVGKDHTLDGPGTDFAEYSAGGVHITVWTKAGEVTQITAKAASMAWGAYAKALGLENVQQTTVYPGKTTQTGKEERFRLREGDKTVWSVRATGGKDGYTIIHLNTPSQ
jgi:hypothetical protein